MALELIRGFSVINMKKIIVAVLLGLLLSTNTFASSIWDFLHIGMTKKQISKHVQGRGIGWNLKSGKGSKYHATKEMQRIRSLYAGRVGGVFYGSVEKIYFPEYKTEILTHWHHRGNAPDIFPFYIFENVTVPQTCSSIWHCRGSYGNGTLKAVVFTRHEALITADPTYTGKKKKKAKQKEKLKEEKRKIAEEKRKKEEKERKIAKEKRKKEKEERNYRKLVKNYGPECESGWSNFFTGHEVGSPEFDRCLIEKKNENNKRLIAGKNKEEQEFAKLSPEGKRAYTCTNTFGFRKGTDKFKDCVFQIYATELEFEKLEVEKKLAEAQLEIAKANREAAEARAQAAKAEGFFEKAQIEASNALVEATREQTAQQAAAAKEAKKNALISILSQRLGTAGSGACKIVSGQLKCY